MGIIYNGHRAICAQQRLCLVLLQNGLSGLLILVEVLPAHHGHREQMGGGNAQKAAMARQRKAEKDKAASKGIFAFFDYMHEIR